MDSEAQALKANISTSKIKEMYPTASKISIDGSFQNLSDFQGIEILELGEYKFGVYNDKEELLQNLKITIQDNFIFCIKAEDSIGEIWIAQLMDSNYIDDVIYLNPTNVSDEYVIKVGEDDYTYGLIIYKGAGVTGLWNDPDYEGYYIEIRSGDTSVRGWVISDILNPSDLPDPPAEELYTYTTNEDGENTITITGFSENYIKKYYAVAGSAIIDECIIPGTIDGYTVTQICWNESLPSNAKKVVYPDSVTSISCNWANWTNGYTTDFVLPKKLVTLGKSAFSDCIGLSSFSIPDGVQTIGKSAFYECESLSSIYIPNTVKTIEDRIFLECDNLTDIYYEGTKEEWEALTQGKKMGITITDEMMHYESNMN